MDKTSKEITDLLIEAEDNITNRLRNKEAKIIADEQGDLSTDIEQEYGPMLGQFLNEKGLPVTIVSEGEVITEFDNGSGDVVFLDPFEGTTNSETGKLPYGVNIAYFSRKEGDILVSDWKSALVTDRHNGFKYCASHTENGDEVLVIQHGRVRAPNNEKTAQIIEVPAGYTKQDSQLFTQMAYYHAIMESLGDNQYRSIDSTGTRLVDVVDGTTRVYVEGRNLPKLGGAWNLIPSSIIINAGGGIATHLDGTPFDNDVVWNAEAYNGTNGYNPNCARDVLACHKIEDHKKCLEAIASIRGKEAEYLSQRIVKAFK